MLCCVVFCVLFVVLSQPECAFDGVRYKEDDLLRAIGGKCDRGMKLTEKELMKGSEVVRVCTASTIKLV